MKNKIAVFVLVLSFVCGLAYAKDQSVAIHGGWQHTSSSAYGDAGTVSARYEHRVFQDFWIGPEYTYHGGMSHSNGQDVSYGDVSGHSILGDLVYYPSFVKAQKIQPYVIGGAGWSFWRFDRSQEVADLGVSVALGDSFSYKAGVGAVYQMSPSYGLVIEISFFKSMVPKDARHADGSESALLGDDGGKIGEEEIRLTLGIKF